MMVPGPLAVALIGIPASGKSAIAGSLSDRLGIERISSDDLIPRNRRGNRIYKKHILRDSWLQVWGKIGRCVKEGQSFVLDAMLLTSERRSPVIGIANGAGFVTVGVFVNTSIEICMIRNSLRKDKVPDSKLLRAASSLDPAAPDEGWTALYRIDQNLSVTRWCKDRLTGLQSEIIFDHLEPALREAVEIFTSATP